MTIVPLLASTRQYRVLQRNSGGKYRCPYVAIVDLDRFKEYNDTHGHQAGDRFLKQIAGAWGQSLRTGDILARYGGEEFVFALPGTNLEHAQLMVDRLRAVLPEDQTCSAGVCQWDGEESAERLTARADTLLYAAKAAGRNRILLD